MAYTSFKFKTPKLSAELETICFKIGMSDDPKAEYEKYPSEVRAEIDALVKEFCYTEYTTNFFQGVRSLAHLSIIHYIRGIILNKYSDHIDDLISSCYEAAIALFNPDEDGNISYDFSKGNFRTYAKRAILGAAADQSLIMSSPLSFTTSVMRAAKQKRDSYLRFFDGVIPDTETIVKEFYLIDPEKTPKRFATKCKSVEQHLVIFKNPVSLFKKALNGDGDELKDLIESNGPTPEEVIIEQEFTAAFAIVAKLYPKEIIYAYYKMRTKAINTEYPMKQAVIDTGKSKNQLIKIFAEIDDLLRDILMGKKHPSIDLDAHK